MNIDTCIYDTKFHCCILTKYQKKLNFPRRLPTDREGRLADQMKMARLFTALHQPP